jgi:hypothetical protein
MSNDSKTPIDRIDFNPTGFKNWAQEERFGLSAKVGGNNGAVLQLVKSPDKKDVRRTVGVTLSNDESGPLKINAQVLLDAVAYAAQATIDICKESDSDPSKVTIPVNYSFASVFASDKQALKDGQRHIKETQHSAFIYAPNFWIGDNKKNDSIVFTQAFDLKGYLLKQLKIINSNYSVKGKNGQWTFSAPKAPTISTNITNDGNMVAMSAATSAGLKANKLYLHTVQGGGGNLNIVKTDAQGKIAKVINTEAFGQPLSSVFNPAEIETIKLIHGNRCDQNIERWTAGGTDYGDDEKGIKESVRYLRALNPADKAKAIAKALRIHYENYQKSSLLKEDFTPSNPEVIKAAHGGDKLAIALLKHQNWITAETIKRNKRLKNLQRYNQHHTIAQLSYHGSAIRKKLKKVESIKRNLEKLLKELTKKIVKHSPELDGSVDLTEAQLASIA